MYQSDGWGECAKSACAIERKRALCVIASGVGDKVRQREIGKQAVKHMQGNFKAK